MTRVSAAAHRRIREVFRGGRQSLARRRDGHPMSGEALPDAVRRRWTRGHAVHRRGVQPLDAYSTWMR